MPQKRPTCAIFSTRSVVLFAVSVFVDNRPECNALSTSFALLSMLTFNSTELFSSNKLLLLLWLMDSFISPLVLLSYVVMKKFWFSFLKIAIRKSLRILLLTKAKIYNNPEICIFQKQTKKSLIIIIILIINFCLFYFLVVFYLLQAFGIF